MGPDTLTTPPSKDLGVMEKVSSKKSESDSALEMWRCTLETDEGAFELKSVLYDYGQPFSPNSSAAFSASSSSSPRMSSLSNKEQEEEEVVYTPEKEAAMSEALEQWKEAATRAAREAMLQPRGTPLFSKLYSFLFGEKRQPTPWWMRKYWKNGARPRGVVANLSVLADRSDVRVVTTAGVVVLVGVGVQKYLSTRT